MRTLYLDLETTGLDPANPRDRPDLTEIFQGTAIRRRRARSAPIDPARED